MIESINALYAQKQKAAPDDYIGEDGLLYCGKCRTRKVFRHYVPFLKREVDAPIVCECRRKDIEQAEKAERQRARMEHIASLRRAGIGDESYRRMTFAADDGGGDREAAGVACRYVQHWEKMLEGNVGLVFSGEPGNGKTFFAACIANALIDKGVPAIITTVPALITAMSADYEAQKPDILRRIKDVDLLVLDDVGVERKTGYEQRIAEEEKALQQAQEEAKRVIYDLPDALQDFCFWYYIEGMSMPDVAAWIDRDISTCWRYKKVIEQETV